MDKVQFRNEFQLYYILYQEGAIHNIYKQSYWQDINTKNNVFCVIIYNPFKRFFNTIILF